MTACQCRPCSNRYFHQRGTRSALNYGIASFFIYTIILSVRDYMFLISRKVDLMGHHAPLLSLHLFPLITASFCPVSRFLVSCIKHSELVSSLVIQSYSVRLLLFFLFVSLWFFQACECQIFISFRLQSKYFFLDIVWNEQCPLPKFDWRRHESIWGRNILVWLTQRWQDWK